MRVAAVDVGTNSTRLLIADLYGGELRRVHAESRITRLGRGVDATGRLSEKAVQQTLEVLQAYSTRIAADGVVRTLAVATSAARDVENASEFLARAAETGMALRILDGDEEARLAFAGATFGHGEDEHLVVDVGGGSTELAVGVDGQLWAARSLDLGCVRLSERYLKSDPPAASELAALSAEARDLLESAAAELAPLPDEALAVGGTATTLASIAYGLEAYDAEVVDQTPLSCNELAALRDRLASMHVAEIAAMPVVQPGRADVLVAGASLLLTVVETLRLTGVIVRDQDILEGIALAAAGLLFT